VQIVRVVWVCAAAYCGMIPGANGLSLHAPRGGGPTPTITLERAPDVPLPAMIEPPRIKRFRIERRGFAAACFFAAALMLVFVDYGDRGPRFAPATAKTDRAGTYDLAKARALARVIGHLRAHYVDPERIVPREMAVAALTAVQREVPEVMVAVARDRRGLPIRVDVTVDSSARAFGLDRVGDLYELNWKLMDVFDFFERSLPPMVDLQELEFTAINGLLTTLDPHSVFLPPRVYREMQLGQRGRFGGLGLVVEAQDGVLTIMSVIGGTPAAEANLQAGDRITQIENESTINMTLSEAVNLLRGEPGSSITIWVMRDGWPASRPIPLTRREIHVPSVESEALPDNIGYIYLRNFQDSTVDDLHAALARLERQRGGLKGLVLDLRDNPGGLLDKAIGVADLFLDRGTIVTTVREGSRERDESHATRADTLTDIPLAVLVNRGSASASEIVAGALKRNDRAIVLGERTFGKGSVQVVYRIDEAALKLTIAQYLTPGDVSIQSVGIVPDVEIVPVAVREDLLDIHPASASALGEAGLLSPLGNNRREEPARSAMSIRILEDRQTQSHQRRRGEAFGMDARVTLAHELLRAAPATDRKQALVQAAGFLSRRQAAEETRIVAALGKLGADWQSGANAARPSLEARLTIRPAEPGHGLIAGGKAVVEAEVVNVGRAPVYRIHGVLESVIEAFNTQEFAFGRIEPGGSIQRSVTINLPKSLTATGDGVRLKLLADHQPIDGGAIALTVVEELPRPLFAHTARIVDPRGNGDGLIQRGETLSLEVRVTNSGLGAAERVVASIKNETGPDVFIVDGRDEIGAIDVGQTRVATFSFQVRETLKARNVQLKLSIVDQVLRVWVHDDLSLRVFPDGFPAREARTGVVTVGEAPTPIRAGAHRDAPEIAEAAPLTVLALRGAAGEWLEVEWEGDLGRVESGWIAGTRVEVGRNGGATSAAVTPSYQFRPPLIELQPIELLTSAGHARIVGTVRFPGTGVGRRHVYVFRGQDKVFFQSATTEATLLDFLELDTDVELVDGANAFTVVAREGHDHVTRRQFTVFKR